MTCRDSASQMVFREEKNRGYSIRRSFTHAYHGFSYVFRTQANFRIHLAIAAIVLLCGLGLGLSGLELAVVALTAALVIFAEMINTVVETVVDLITLNHDPRAKVAKDVSAGAVLLSAVGSIFVGILVFGPHLLRRLG